MVRRSKDIIAIIPARFASTRFPGKPLAEILGKPMIQYVYEQTARCELVEFVIVATDDKRIYDTVKGFGGEAMITSTRHVSGSDRVAEVAIKIDADIVVNVQGDEPLLNPKMVTQVTNLLLEDESVNFASLKYPIQSIDELMSPQVVKVVTDEQDFALYFSRSPIPYIKNFESEGYSLRQLIEHNPKLLRIYFKHIGIYAYKKDSLLKCAKLKPSPLELSEGLEQLRVLEHGYKIKIGESKYSTIGVDTPEDLAMVTEILRDKR